MDGHAGHRRPLRRPKRMMPSMRLIIRSKSDERQEAKSIALQQEKGEALHVALESDTGKKNYVVLMK